MLLFYQSQYRIPTQVLEKSEAEYTGIRLGWDPASNGIRSEGRLLLTGQHDRPIIVYSHRVSSGFAQGISFGLLILTGILLYLPWLSRRYDLNGLIEAWALENGALFSPHHLVYRPVGAIWHSLLSVFMPLERSIPALQALSALCGVIGLAGCFWIVRRWGLSSLASAGFALALGISWSYWIYSTDASYIIPAHAAAVLFLLCLDAEPLSRKRALIAALMNTLAIALWQAHIFLLLLWIGRWAFHKSASPRTLRHVREGLLATLLFTALFYGGAGFWTLRSLHPLEWIRWVITYETRLPVWGRLDMERLPEWVRSAVASWIPITDGLGWRAVGRGEIPELLPFISPVALLLALSLALPRLIRALRQDFRWPSPAMALTMTCYGLFILWWDPAEPKWFISLNLFLILLLARGWRVDPGSWRAGAALWACVGLIATANFSRSILPRHQGPHPYRELAHCVAQHMSDLDLFLATDWMWAEYLRYFHRRDVLSLLDLSARHKSKAIVSQRIYAEIQRIHQRAGKVYMSDPAAYPAEYLQWLQIATGFLREDLEALQGHKAFRCLGLQFFEVR